MWAFGEQVSRKVTRGMRLSFFIHPETHYQHCRVLRRGDGWQYTQKRASEQGGQGGFLPGLKAEGPAANL